MVREIKKVTVLFYGIKSCMYLRIKTYNMDANNILTANLLDIIFEGKNKDYGAYELRNTYNKRVSIAMIITLGAIAILLFAFTIANNYSSKNFIISEGNGNVLKAVLIPDPPPPPLPPPPLKPPPPVKTVEYFPPVIHKNTDVIEPPPDIKEIMASRIGPIKIDGPNDKGVIEPPINIVGSQVIAKLAGDKHELPVFIPIERDASFPGGAAGWAKYIQREIEKNLDEFSEADFGTCVVHFMVDKNGKVSQVEATTMKGSKLAEIAVNAIRKGPDWIPALQNGTFVTAPRTQPIVFKNLSQ